MFKNHKILSYLKYSIAAALLYCITAYIFIHDDSYYMAYILYIGNMLFACSIIIFLLRYNKNRKENASTGVMIFAGHITAVMGILLACLFCVLLLLLFSPGVFHHTSLASDLKRMPPQMSGKAHGTILILFMNAVFGNISVGSFFSIVIPYAAKRNQKGSSAVIKEGSETDNQITG